MKTFYLVGVHLMSAAMILALCVKLINERQRPDRLLTMAPYVLVVDKVTADMQWACARSENCIDLLERTDLSLHEEE